MAISICDSDNMMLLNFIFDELLCGMGSPALEYLTLDLEPPSSDHLAAVADPAEMELQLCRQEPLRSECSDSPSNLLLNVTDEKFYHLFKFGKKTTEDLIRILEGRHAFCSETAFDVSISKKVLMTCWLLTSGEEFSKASKIFAVDEYGVSEIFSSVCAELTKLVGEYVKWPNKFEADNIIDAFENQFGFPGVVGVIGYCAFQVNTFPLKLGVNKCYNPKSERHSLVLQAVCDDKMIFRDVRIGFQEQRKPSDLLMKSSLYSQLLSRTSPLMNPGTYILGSSEYPQLPSLLTPYHGVRERPLDEMECKFNELHSSARSTIYKCFSALNTRFSRLRHCNFQSTSEAMKVVLAACVIHNFALLRNDTRLYVS